jgi:hypothetical protein
MDGLLHQGTSPDVVARGGAKPFRMDADQLVAMFKTIDAGTPTWHRARARTLLRDSKLQPVAAVTDAWSRLAARHLATAMLLEEQQQAIAPVEEVGRRHRFRRHA